MRSLGIASLLVAICLPAASRADETINLQLPTPGAVTAPSASTPKQAAPKNTARPPAPNRHASVPRTPPEKVIGRLGLATRPATIRRGRGSRYRALITTSKGTYLALTHDSGDWYGVLMADRSTGWIRKTDVEVLNYEVVAPNTPPQPEYASANDYTGSALLSGGQKTLLDVAFSYLGVRYKYGGTAPTGLDCSAFVQRCFASLGIRLPRTAHEQINCGMPITPEQLQPCDRLYFASRNGRISHTGIYIGNGYFIHASSSRGRVAVSRLSEPLYRRMYAGARR